MLIRSELHNHTTESDASITVRELIDFMLEDKVDAFAITDHNTISGHRKVREILENEKLPIECIYGMEYTTYYGHILCLNLEKYVPWENINKNNPEKLFKDAKAAGALVGMAHPYSFGAPYARGCRWEMNVTDYSCVDFIEVFNNPEPLHEVNEPGLALWESLVLAGNKLAMTCGMDLHGKWNMKGQYATYFDRAEGESVSMAITRAIKAQRTYITRGPVFEAFFDTNGALCGKLYDVVKNGYTRPASPYCVKLTDASGEKIVPFSGACEVLSNDYKKNGLPIIAKLYEGEPIIENLVAISPVVI